MPLTKTQQLEYIAHSVSNGDNAATEGQLGLPFIGNSGKLLHKLLMSISLNRSEVFIANILKHRPPENRDPLPEEIRVYTPYLKAQLKITKPKVVITLDRFAMNYFLQPNRFPISGVKPEIVSGRNYH